MTQTPEGRLTIASVSTLGDGGPVVIESRRTTDTARTLAKFSRASGTATVYHS